MQRGRYRWVLNRGRSLRGHVEQPPDLVASSQLGLTMITEPVLIHPDRSGAGLRVELLGAGISAVSWLDQSLHQTQDGPYRRDYRPSTRSVMNIRWE